jgi:hypothetical protein
MGVGLSYSKLKSLRFETERCIISNVEKDICEVEREDGFEMELLDIVDELHSHFKPCHGVTKGV